MTRRSPLAFFHPSNLVTYLSVAAGLAAMVLARPEDGSRSAVGVCLAVASLADLLDGRFARLFSRDAEAKRFGVQIDSLADAVAFGVAPVVALSRLGADEHGALRIVWAAAAIFYVLAALTRLGFYNIADDAQEFVGVPTTIVGALWSGLLLAPVGPWTIAPLVLLGIAMVAPVRIARPRVAVFVVLIAVTLGLAVAHALPSRGHPLTALVT
jgi:CDP-diacylglycerol--serine O-phosphatidyltransferase